MPADRAPRGTREAPRRKDEVLAAATRVFHAKGYATASIQDVADELAQLPEAIRGETLELVILAAAADGQIHPHERAIVDTIAQQLGVSEEALVEKFKKVLPG